MDGGPQALTITPKIFSDVSLKPIRTINGIRSIRKSAKTPNRLRSRRVFRFSRLQRADRLGRSGMRSCRAALLHGKETVCTRKLSIGKTRSRGPSNGYFVV